MDSLLWLIQMWKSTFFIAVERRGKWRSTGMWRAQMRPDLSITPRVQRKDPLIQKILGLFTWWNVLKNVLWLTLNDLSNMWDYMDLWSNEADWRRSAASHPAAVAALSCVFNKSTSTHINVKQSHVKQLKRSNTLLKHFILSVLIAIATVAVSPDLWLS